MSCTAHTRARCSATSLAGHRTTALAGSLGRTTLGLATLALVLSISFVAVAPKSASAISRDEVLRRAQTRVDAPVPYSQAKYYGGYRTDCSGYVSMCWQTGTSWSTRSFYLVSHPIPAASLKPGDAMLKPGYHIRLFYGWLDEAHTRYVAYESGSGQIAVCRIHSYADDYAVGYRPTRYDRITSSATPRNILKNGNFNSWAREWSGAPEEPVWWEATEVGGQPLAVRRKDTYRTSRNSLKLANPDGNRAVRTQISQSVPVLAGVPYNTSAWAKTPCDPAGVELRVAYLNATGGTLSQASTTGDRAALTATSFRLMSVVSTPPAGTARALVTVRLAGGTTTDASATATTGTSVTLDDIALCRPYIAVGIKASRATAYNGTSVTLSGSVTPTRSIGAPAVLCVQRPGAAWSRVGTVTVSAAGGSAGWKGKFSFQRGMRRGTYRFKTKIPSIPGYLGATSSIVSVRLR